MSKAKIRPLTDSEISTFAEAIAACAQHKTEFMATPVFDLATRARGSDAELEMTFAFTARVLAPHVMALERIDPQNPFWVDPKSMTDAEVAVLKQLWDIRDDELRARVGDYLWLRTRDRQFAEGAIDAYLAIATARRDADDWVVSAERYARAVTLAKMLGRKTERYRRAIEKIDEYVRSLDATDPLFMTIRLMEVLLDAREGDRVFYGALAEKGATTAQQRQRFDIAAHYLTLARRWYEAADDPDAVRRVRVAEAESVILDAESRVASNAPSYLVAAGLLHAAIVMLKKIGGTRERIAELMPRLRGYEQRGVSEMKRIRATDDVTDWVAASRAHVAGRSLSDAIAALTELVGFPDPAKLREDVLENAKTFLSSSFAVSIVNTGGAMVAGMQGVSGDEDEDSDPVVARMHHDAARMFAMSGYADVDVARRQIEDEHGGVRAEDLLPIVTRSWFVPPAREYVFAKGLSAGFGGDIMTAIHLLIPQVEAAIRYCLIAQGVDTTIFDRNGYQKERDLNQLLPMPETRALLGERVQFALRTILTSSVGGNLRNKLAHGLLDVIEMSSSLAVFLWAIVLWICCRAVPNDASGRSQNNSRQTAE